MDECICKKLNKEESILIEEGSWNTLRLERDEYGNYYIVAKADGNAYMNINYCPLCGRKL